MARTFISGRKVSKLPTRALNEAIEAARDAQSFGNRQTLQGLATQYLISVRNDTVADDFERFDAIGLNESLIDPDENEIGFVAGVNLSGVVPTFNHVSRFAVAMEPIEPGRMGRAMLYGITAARVDIKSLQHRFCQPADGVQKLQSADFGGARIIWPIAPTSLGEQWCVVLLTGNGTATAGERIAGRLYTEMPAPLTTAGSGREPGTALLQVFSTDPDNTLEQQDRNRYDIIDVAPTDPLDLLAGQSFVIAEDVRFRLVENHPIYVVESTSRDGTYFVESVTWDAGAGECTIATTNAIAEVLDPAPPNDPIVDGVILIPGGDRRIPSDRFEIVENYGGRTANVDAWCQATHDGAAYVVDYVDS